MTLTLPQSSRPVFRCSGKQGFTTCSQRSLVSPHEGPHVPGTPRAVAQRVMTEHVDLALTPRTSPLRCRAPRLRGSRDWHLEACEFSQNGLEFGARLRAGGEAREPKPECWELARFHVRAGSSVCFSGPCAPGLLPQRSGWPGQVMRQPCVQRGCRPGLASAPCSACHTQPLPRSWPSG